MLPEINDKFLDAEEVYNALNDIETDLDSEKSNNLLILSKVSCVVKIFESYQEKPCLLDTSLQDIFLKTFRLIIKLSIESSKILDIDKGLFRIFEIPYTLCKVRGLKKVVHFFPPEVYHLEPVVELLIKFSAIFSDSCIVREVIYSKGLDENIFWKPVYCLFGWIYNLLLLPFDISSIDSDSDKIGKTMTDKIIKLCAKFIGESSIASHPASLALSRLFTRQDVLKTHPLQVKGFVTSVLNLFAENQNFNLDNIFMTDEFDLINLCFLRRNSLRTIVSFLKAAERNDVYNLIEKLGIVAFTDFIDHCYKNLKSSGERKLTAKLSEALALSLLPSVEDKNIATTEIFATYPDQVQKLLQLSIFFLADYDSNVRWTAAKGIGRIIERIPSKELKDSLVSSLSTNKHCHGSLLALSEMTRKGSLKRETLDDVLFDNIMNSVFDALLFEEEQRKASFGRELRDAACFYVWAFSRIESQLQLVECEEKFIYPLISVALFDRDVNSRRCACAAIQEYLGRIGTSHQNEARVKNRLFIIQNLNFFTVSSLQKCFSEVAVALVQNDKRLLTYLKKFLLKSKFGHWNDDIRAKTCKLLVQLEGITGYHDTLSLIENLVSICVNDFSNIEKNSALTLLALLLEKKRSHKREHFKLSADMTKTLRNLIMKMERNRCYRGRKGELIRSSVLKFIAVLYSYSQNDINLSLKTSKRFLLTIKEGLFYCCEIVQGNARVALQRVITLSLTFSHDDNNNVVDEFNELLCQFKKEAKLSLNVSHRKGSVLALSILNSQLCEQLDSDPKEILHLFLFCALKSNVFYRAENKTQKACFEELGYSYNLNSSNVKLYYSQGTDSANDARVRCVALKSMFLLQKEYLLFENNEEMEQYLSILFLTIFLCLQDYDNDERGDVGVWVRKEALLFLQNLTISQGLCSEISKSLKLQELLKGCFGSVVRVLFERNYILSAISYQVLVTHNKMMQNLFHNFNLVPDISFENEDFLACEHYKICTKLIESKELRRNVVIGFLSSISDLTETVQKKSLIAFCTFAKSMQKAEVLNVCIDELSAYSSTDEQHVFNLLKALNILNETLDIFAASASREIEKLVMLLGQQSKTKSFRNLSLISRISVSLFGQRNVDKEFEIQNFRTVLNLLSHRYSRIRKDTAESLYLKVIASSIKGLSTEKNKTFVEDLIISTNWKGLGDERKLVVSKIASALNIKLKSKADEINSKSFKLNSIPEEEKENGYQQLIQELGQ